MWSYREHSCCLLLLALLCCYITTCCPAWVVWGRVAVGIGCFIVLMCLQWPAGAVGASWCSYAAPHHLCLLHTGTASCTTCQIWGAEKAASQSCPAVCSFPDVLPSSKCLSFHCCLLEEGCCLLMRLYNLRMSFNLRCHGADSAEAPLCRE